MVVIYVASKLAIFFFFKFSGFELIIFVFWVVYSLVFLCIWPQCISCASFQNGLCDYAF